MDILRAAAEDYVLGRCGAENLPVAAAEALCRGLDCPALRELAGLGRAEVREAEDLVRLAMVELGHPLQGRRGVLSDRLRGIAGDLVAGVVEPPDGARALAVLLWGITDLDGFHDRAGWAARFEDLSVDWDDYPEERGEIAGQTRMVASDLLAWLDVQPPS